jgi:hypothetical protein
MRCELKTGATAEIFSEKELWDMNIPQAELR